MELMMKRTDPNAACYYNYQSHLTKTDELNLNVQRLKTI